MADFATLKAQLVSKAEDARADRIETAVAAETLKELVTALAPHNPVPDPMNRQDKVEGHWVGIFSHYGSAHSRGNILPAPSSLKTHSFGNMPDVKVMHLSGAQEIKAADKSYNNVSLLETMDGTMRANCIVYGRYAPDDEDPQRFHVSFYRYALEGLNGESADDLRAGFGLEPDAVIDGAFKPPRLHSDIVYLDDDIRVNYGGHGGVYVMRLDKDHPGVSVRF